MKMSRRSLLLSTDRGWSVCWNESQPTWIPSAWYRMTRTRTKNRTTMILEHVIATSWPNRHPAARTHGRSRRNAAELRGIRCGVFCLSLPAAQTIMPPKTSGPRGRMVSYNDPMEKSRIAALVDGIFAVAMTLLVLDLKLPEGVKINSDPEAWRRLLELTGRISTYGLSFIILGTFWIG